GGGSEEDLDSEGSLDVTEAGFPTRSARMASAAEPANGAGGDTEGTHPAPSVCSGGTDSGDSSRGGSSDSSPSGDNSNPGGDSSSNNSRSSNDNASNTGNSSGTSSISRISISPGTPCTYGVRGASTRGCRTATSPRSKAGARNP
ncbi:unnamed protein product, partial [Pylaiella littoralis]